MTQLHLPANIEAERSLLGSIMLDPDLMTILDLSPTDFYRETHATIFEAMQRLWHSGFPIDFTVLTDELERAGKLPEIVTPADLTGLIDGTPTALYGQHYASIVKRASVARQYLAMAQKLAEKAHGSQDIDEIYSWIMEQIATIHSGMGDDKALLMWLESFPAFRRILEEEERRIESGEGGWSWPWASWDKLLGDAQPGMGVYLAAATSHGKTIYAECIAEHWARLGKQVVFVHLELNRKIMLARRAARHTGIDSRVILSGNLSPPQKRLIIGADASLERWPGRVHYLHAPGWTSERIIRELTRLHEQGECDAFIVDYVQKIHASNSQLRRFRNEYDMHANDVEQLKNFAEAKELRMVTLGQLTKDGQDIRFSDLSLTKLRGSQEIADRVNTVGLLYRPKVEAGKVDERGEFIVRPGGLDVEAKIKFVKHTMGEQGAIEQLMVPPQFNVFDREE